MSTKLLEALEEAKRDERIDIELAKSSALLSPLSLSEISDVGIQDAINVTKTKVNLEIAQLLKSKGLL